MPENAGNPLSFFQELKRRKVIRVIIVYAAASFVILELASIIQEPFGLPDWTIRLVFIILLVGLIIAIILSWIYDITPEGIEKTKPAREVQDTFPGKPSKVNAWKVATFISTLIIAGFIIFHVTGTRKESDNIISELERRIAVLPFDDMSPQKDQEYFCDGIAEEIINALVQVEGLNVIARTSAFSFKGKQMDIREIGNKLGAGTLLEGSIRKEGNRMRITTQLIKAEDGSHLWSEQYDRNIESIFEIQAEIALAVVENLKIELLAEEKATVVKHSTKNLTAYDYYLRGNDYYWKSFEQQDFKTAIVMFEKAIELDPDFAIAHTKLAMSHLFIYWLNYDPSEGRLKKSKQAIDAAFKIEPELAEAYIALGRYNYVLLDYSQALKQYEKALNKSPKHSECIFSTAAAHRRAGNWDKALKGFQKAFELDPRSSRQAWEIADTYTLMREYSEALQYYDIAIRLRPDWIALYTGKSHVIVKWEGNTQKARSILNEANQMITSTDDEPRLRRRKIMLDLYDGNYKEALKKSETYQGKEFRYRILALIHGLTDNPRLEYAYYDSLRMMFEDTLQVAQKGSRFYSNFFSNLGIAYAGLGRKTEAIKAGERAVESLPISKEAMLGSARMADLARIYAMVDEPEKALEKIELLLSIPGYLSTNLLELDPVWKSLWDHPEFIRLTDKYSQ